MADLLECLIQVKALGATLDAVSRSISGAGGLDQPGAQAVWQRMAEAERRFAAALGVAEASRAANAADAFLRLRRDNLDMLGRCAAEDLSRLVVWPERRATTVADLVAIMLAHDTEAVGELRHPSRRAPPAR